MIRQITYQPKDSEKMKTKWIFRDDGDLAKDYSDFKTIEVMLNKIYEITDSHRNKNKNRAYWDIADIFDKKMNGNDV